MADVTILQLPTLTPAAITGADVLPIVDVSDLTDPGGTTKQVTVDGLGYYTIPHGTRTVQNLQSYLANNASYNVMDFGAAGDGVTDDSVAFQAAMTAANTAGGGIVTVPNKTFSVSQLTFAGLSHVFLMGQSPAFNYNNSTTASLLLVTTGVWGIRFPATSLYCGMMNIGLQSTGVLSASPPHVVVTAGVEYGVVIETNSTVMRACTVYGFQHGIVGASGLNSNVFDQVSSVWNTKTGFACTFGSNAAYAAYHPNLTPPASPIASTVYTIRDCQFRRNGWGMISRDGTPAMEGTNVIEANWFGGLVIAIGALDLGVVSLKGRLYLEANWLLYDTTAAYTITQNNLLKDAAGTWLAFATNASTALNEAGYQLYALTGAGINSATAGPIFVTLTDMNIVCGSSGATPGKGMYLRQCYGWDIIDANCTGGDQPNAVRLGNGTGSFNANAVRISDWNGTLPALTGTGAVSCASFIRDRGFGGTRATQGAFLNFVQTGTSKVSHMGKGDDFFAIQNSKTMTVTIQGMILMAVTFGNTADSVLLSSSYTTATITALTTLPSSIVLSNSPTANQVGIFKSANSHVVSVIAGSTAATPLVNMGLSVIGSDVTAVSDWA